MTEQDLPGLGSGKWNFEACRQRLREATGAVIEAEGAYHKAVERSADAEAVYRAQLAEKFGGYRSQGKAVEESTTFARRDVGVLGRERDYAAGLMRLRLEQLEDARDSRRSVWRLIEWARGVDLVNKERELTPAGTQQELDARMGR